MIEFKEGEYVTNDEPDVDDKKTDFFIAELLNLTLQIKDEFVTMNRNLRYIAKACGYEPE